MAEKEKETGEAGGVKVTDRRRFTPEGGTRPETATGETPPPPSAAGAATSETTSRKSYQQVDFPTFILSLATSLQIHLGLVPNPATGKPAKDLTLARQTIDILGILEEKTKGNLSKNETELLTAILYEVRMAYVELGGEKT